MRTPTLLRGFQVGCTNSQTLGASGQQRMDARLAPEQVSCWGTSAFLVGALVSWFLPLSPFPTGASRRQFLGSRS